MGLKHILAQNGVHLRARTLVWPHHGGNVKPGATATHNVFYALALSAAVAPRTVVVSNGRPRRGFPRPEVVSAVRRHIGGELRWCCTQLSAACAATLPVRDDNHLLPAYAAGRLGGSCCAGSIIVWQNGQALPNLATYEAFKTRSAPTALCRLPLAQELTAEAGPVDVRPSETTP